MNQEPLRMVSKAEELRRTFDQSFAELPTKTAEAAESLLAVRIGGDPYVIRVGEITGVASARKVMSLPSRIPETLGLAGIRGSLVPVFSLASLVGYAVGNEPPRWLALCAIGPDPVGLGFSELEGYLEVPRAEVYAADEIEGARSHVKEVVRSGPRVRGVICMASVMETIQLRVARFAPAKENDR